jgi:outer membrane protein OmpA-like peptidoglycan-associated protein
MRTSLLLFALLCAFALLAAPAGADTTIATAGSDVTVTATTGIANDVTIAAGAAPGTVRITEMGDTPSNPDATCTAVDAASVDCPVSGRVTIDLGDDADTLAANAAPVPITVTAGDGDDTLALANSTADDVTCGPGADDAAATDALDTLAADCEETRATAGEPDTSIVAHPDAESDHATGSFEFAASEAATFECSLDGAGYGACDTTASFPGLADGPHTLAVRAIDRVAKVDPTPASFGWTIDTRAPAVAFSASPDTPTNTTSADFTFGADEAPAAMDCRLDTGAWAACDSLSTMHYATVPEGRHTVTVKATDAAGNAGTGAVAWTVDVTAPTLLLTSAPPALTNDATPTFAVAASEPSTYQCGLDGAALVPCTAAPTFSSLVDGPHTLVVRATDAAGNPAQTSPYTWTQDTLRPQTTLTAGPASSVAATTARATFTFTTSRGGVRFECSLDAAAWQGCASPVTYTGLPNGTHTFAVRAVDAAGNPDGTPASRTWTVRVEGAPTARIAVTRDGDGFTLSGAGSADPEGRALVYRWLRNGDPAGATPTVSYTAPDHETRDVYTLTVTDPAGRQGRATVALRTRATTETAAHEAMEVVRFGAGTRLAPGAKARVSALRAAIASGGSGARVRIDGYASRSGDATRVAKARAQAVRRLLAKGAAKGATFTVAGRGADAPAASNATAAGRARNDRVVVTVRSTGPATRLVTEQEDNPAVSRTTAPQPVAAATGAAPKLFAFYSAVPGALRRLQEVGSRVDVLAPNWYTLAPATGAISGGQPNARVMALSRTLRFTVWPVVNATMGGSALIDSPAGRTTVVTSIAKLAAKHRLAGVTLDMEEMRPRQKASYSALIAQLASALHAKHRKLAVYAVRRTATDVDDSGAAYDWPALARSADLVLASGYNEHSAVTTPGPVSTRAGFAALASYAAATSRTKVVPTMGAFGYQWTGSGARMLSSAEAERRWPVAAEVGSADGRAEIAGATTTYFESAEDLWAREQEARRAGARWIGLFTLGREPERFWERSAIR